MPNAYQVYLFYVGGTAFIYRLIFTVNMFYYVEQVGLNPIELVLTGTALELSAFLFEIPTGILADVYSRRLSIIIGTVITGLAFLLNGLPHFGLILAAQVLWGLGYTFGSGATNAWITDEIGEEAANRAFLRGNQVWQIAAIASVPFSVVLARADLQLPTLIGGSLFLVLAGILVATMPETGFHPTPSAERSTFQQMRATFQGGLGMVKRRPILFNLLLMGMIMGAFSEGYDRLWVAHLTQNITFPEWGAFEPVIWLGIIEIVGQLAAIGAVEGIQRMVDITRQPAIVRALQSVSSLLLFSLVLFALTQQFWLALVAIWLISVSRSMIEPLYQAWVNQGLDSQVRATVFSMASQADAFGQIAGGPIMGLVGTWFSIPTAMLGSAIILSPILWVYRLTLQGMVPAENSLD